MRLIGMVLVIVGLLTVLVFPALGFWTGALGIYCSDSRIPVREWGVIGVFGVSLFLGALCR